MTATRALVVDDEPLARLRLRQLLEEEGGVEIAECANGAEALEAMADNPPELLFLDVQMPVMDGFSILDRLHPAQPPIVVFVTAYDHYAVRAFEKCALDYLLKPFDDARFSITMARVRERIAAGSRQRESLFFAVGQRDGTRIVPAADTDWISAAGNYVELHAGEKVLLHRESLRAIESRMCRTMLRVHRSALVNRDKVQRIRWTSHGDGEAILEDGRTVPISRRYSASVRTAFSPVHGTSRPA